MDREQLVDRIGANAPPDSETPTSSSVRSEPLAKIRHPRSRRGSGTSTTIIAASPASTRSRGSVEAAAMPMDEAALAEVRQANAHFAADYERRLAAEIVAMLPDDRDGARRVLAYIDAILNLSVGN
jgi:hypothetical protein